jgi:RND family efflux transporter MFP subunit
VEDLQAGWKYSLKKQRDSASTEQLLFVVELLGLVIEQSTFDGATTVLVTKLATMLECDRVSLGWIHNNHVDVVALSHCAHFEEKTNLCRNIANTMTEAMDQYSTILYPQSSEGTVKMTKLHAQLAKENDSQVLATMLLGCKDTLVGAITLERIEPSAFDSKWIEICEMACSLVGPVLFLKKEEDRWLGAKIKDSVADLANRLIGPGYLISKIVSGIVVAILLGGLVFKGEHLITANAQLEGSIQRAITSPIEGYIAQTHVKAGDIVKKDDILASLDDADLSLEQMKIVSEKSQIEKEYREALSKRDKSKVAIFSAKMKQMEAKIELINAQLDKIKFKAPFTGVIIEGDLSQALGSPVEKGQVLFKMAPLETYRIILNVNESDIANVQVDQAGTLVLSSLPKEEISFKVKRIIPVSFSDQGNNYFRVEALLLDETEKLRPGMEGVAKIEAGKARLIWRWTHKMFNWIRLKIWAWG